MNYKRTLLFGTTSLLVAVILSSCSPTEKFSQKHPRETQLRRPPASVERAWLARHQYDPERRIVIPKYKGARWGSILEYNEKENLVYRDWWVRDVKMQELDPEPSTQLTPFSQIEGGGVAETVTKGETDGVVLSEDSTEPDDDNFSVEEEPSVFDKADPFAPVQEPPAFDETDPFAPVQEPMEDAPIAPVKTTPSEDPFSPLPL